MKRPDYTAEMTEVLASKLHDVHFAAPDASWMEQARLLLIELATDGIMLVRIPTGE